MTTCKNWEEFLQRRLIVPSTPTMSQSPLFVTPPSAIKAAREFHQQLTTNAAQAQQQDFWWQVGIGTLAMLATVLAVLPCTAGVSLVPEGVLQLSQVGLVLVGLVFTTVVSLSDRRQSHQIWLTLKAGVAAMERAIYFYRTLLQVVPDRDRWLNQQVAQIQQQVQERLSQSWVLQPVELILPEDPSETMNLLAEGYLEQRLMGQLHQAEQTLATLVKQRSLLQGATLISIGSVVLVPVFNGLGNAWSLLALNLGLALLLWRQTLAIDPQIADQNQLSLGLKLLRDYWQSLGEADCGGQTFFRLVIAAENLIESPYRQVGDQVRESLGLVRQPEPDLPQKLLLEPVPATLEQALRQIPPLPVQEVDETVPETETHPTPAVVAEAAIEAEVIATSGNGKTAQVALPAATPVQTLPPAPPAAKRGRPHAFVVMPFGRKQGPDGRWIDFNSIYQTLIKPALENAGFEPFRADEEASSGDILTDMFQELLLADLVIADLSIDNANVFYELGIRHAFRRRGVVHIQAGRAYMPFDIFNVRTLPYHCDETGCPDHDFLEKDKQALVKMIQATWTSERNRVHSPIFNLLTGLAEPPRKSLRTPLAMGYWQEYTVLQSRIAIAQRQKRIGDVVLLTEEVSNPLIKEDILAEAGKALKSMGNSALALKQYRQGLKINPENVTFRCEEAYHLSRLGQSDEAIVKLEHLLQDVPDCVDATTYLARIYKDLWKQNWSKINDDKDRLRVAYESSFLLQRAIENYLRGYRLDQNQYYPAINALTLTALLDHLASLAETESGDADEALYRSRLAALKGSVQFCLESNLHKSPNDQWAALSLGDLAVCVAESPYQVATAYRKALAILWNNKYGLQATLEHLILMQALQFRPEHVEAGIQVLQTELERIEQQERLFARGEEDEEQTKPVQVFLFTGHMVDGPHRAKPRFPVAMEPEVVHRLEQTLDKLDAHSNCIAILPGLACGGDILFAEACLQRGIQIDIYLPFEPSEFIQDSVNFAGDHWVERFYAILNHPNITLHLQPERLGAIPEGDNAYGRNNRWALYSTLAHDIRSVRLIALWNGQGGDGPGGTADMVQQVRQLGGIVEHLDITKFDYWREQSTVASLLHANP